MDSLSGRLAPLFRAGDRVAVAGGVGSPTGLFDALEEVAAAAGGVHLFLGWTVGSPPDLSNTKAFRTVLTFMSTHRAVSDAIALGRAGYVPARVGALPGLIAGVLRPDVVVAGMRSGTTGFAFGTEVAWLPAAIESGARVAVEVNHALPRASAESDVPATRLNVVSEVERYPVTVPSPSIDQTSAAIGRHVAALIPEGATIQFGPGKIARAVLAALEVPVVVDSGVLSDEVVELDDRGLLLGEPSATYLVGGDRLYAWADGRPVLRRIEYTHDVRRLAFRCFVSINTAFEIDRRGAANVEGFPGRVLAGTGGHGDYALAAARSVDGLSIVALPSSRRGRSTLQDCLSVSASTAHADVDVVVTEHGVADLRGLSTTERSHALDDLWKPVGEA